MPEEKERYRAFQPLLQILFDLALSVLIANGNTNLCAVGIAIWGINPPRFREPLSIEGNRQGRSVDLDGITQAERTLETYAAEADRMQITFVGICKAT